MKKGNKYVLWVAPRETFEGAWSKWKWGKCTGKSHRKGYGVQRLVRQCSKGKGQTHCRGRAFGRSRPCKLGQHKRLVKKFVSKKSKLYKWKKQGNRWARYYKFEGKYRRYRRIFVNKKARWIPVTTSFIKKYNDRHRGVNYIKWRWLSDGGWTRYYKHGRTWRRYTLKNGKYVLWVAARKKSEGTWSKWRWGRCVRGSQRLHRKCMKKNGQTHCRGRSFSRSRRCTVSKSNKQRRRRRRKSVAPKRTNVVKQKPTSNSHCATLFRKGMYHGRKTRVYTANPFLRNTGNVRSFRIFKGWRLLVFSGTLYSGKKRWFATGNWDMPSLGPMGFKVNSVRCYRAHGYPRRRPSKPKASTNCATFYSDPMWHGSTYTVQKSSAVMRKLNNQVSSFIVKRGWKLTVYEGKGYRGKHHGFSTGKYDRSTLGPIGNDKISSFRCKRV